MPMPTLVANLTSTHPQPAIEASCAWCGVGLASLPGHRTEEACGTCGRPFTSRGNVRRWTDGAAPRLPRALWTLAWRQLNPLSSRLSPLRYLTDWRIEQFYRRTLTDRRLAEDWAQHYLGGLRLPAGAAVLDHGCGRGRHTALLDQLGYRVAAQDVVAHPWWRHLRQPSFQQVPGEAPRLPWSDEAFHLVLDVEVIHYLSADRLERLAREVFRTLVPGGCWLLLEANDQAYGARTMRRTIGALHSLAAVRRCLSAVGYRELDLGYEGFNAPVLPRAVNWALKVARPGPADFENWRTPFAGRIPPHRRKLWRLRVTKPSC
jgi:SAM-dependent methyltransferase